VSQSLLTCPLTFTKDIRTPGTVLAARQLAAREVSLHHEVRRDDSYYISQASACRRIAFYLFVFRGCQRIKFGRKQHLRSPIDQQPAQQDLR
jgi:hypothetical protein